MAIISHGRVLAAGEPAATIRDVEGRIWRREVGKQELGEYVRDYNVISTRLVAGRNVVHVYSDERPHPTFEPVQASLEDVYFSTLQRAKAEAA
jgi:hypothetical protein